MSPSLTGPFTLRTIERPAPDPSFSMNSTRTWVTLPVLPVRPRTLFTFASFTGWSCRWGLNNKLVFYKNCTCTMHRNLMLSVMHISMHIISIFLSFAAEISSKRRFECLRQTQYPIGGNGIPPKTAKVAPSIQSSPFKLMLLSIIIIVRVLLHFIVALFSADSSSNAPLSIPIWLY